MKTNLKDYSWDMGGYFLRVIRGGEKGAITLADAAYAYQLVPELQKQDRMKDPNDYVICAQNTHEMKYLFFFLSENEQFFNHAIEQFISKDGSALTPDRYLEMKLACRQSVLNHFTEYDSTVGASFLTFLRLIIKDTLLNYRLGEEEWSVSSLTKYRQVRKIMAIYQSQKGNELRTLRIYCHQEKCKPKAARRMLDAARRMRQRALPVCLNEEEGEWQQEDEMISDSWDYVSILYDGTEAEKVDKAFDRMTYREQTLLEERNAICMHCGRVSLLRKRASFEDLAAMFEGSSTSGAERAYAKAVEKLTIELAKVGGLHCVRFHQKSVVREGQKVTSAIYEYLVDHDGGWGAIQFDLINQEAQVIEFSKRDTDPHPTWAVEDAVIHTVLASQETELIKTGFLPVAEEHLE